MDDWHRLNYQLQIESLITEREMMKTANEHRAMQGYSQAYGDEAFLNVQKCFEALLNSLRNDPS